MVTPLYKDTSYKVKNVAIDEMDFNMAVRLMSISQYQRPKMSHYLYKRGQERSASNFFSFC